MCQFVTITTRSAEETEALGRSLGAALFPGTLVALVGPLGAGKTQFARGVALGLGIASASAVTSPTFVLIHEHQARLPVYHFDTYRLSSAGEMLDLGATEYFQGDGVCLIEWADRVAEILPPDHLRVEIEVKSESERELKFHATGSVHAPLLAALRVNNE